MGAALPLLLAAALGVNAQADLGLRTEARARLTDPPLTPAEKGGGIDLTASPHLRLQLAGGGDFLALSYTPRFTARDVQAHTFYESTHEGELRLHLAPDPTWTFEAFGGGLVGRTDLVTLSQSRPSGTTPGGGPGTSTTGVVTSTQVIDIQRLQGGLSLRLAPDRRDEVLLSASGSVDGGANARSRAAYPIARVVDGAAEYRRSTTRLDQLGLRLSLEWGRIPRVGTASTATAITTTALGILRHRFSPELETWAGAGATAFSSRVTSPVPAERSTTHDVQPAAELGLVRTPPPRIGDQAQGVAAVQKAPALTLRDTSADAVAHLGAAMDRTTGLATPQLDATASVSAPATDHLALTLRGTGVLTWPRTGRTRSGSLSLGASYKITARVILDGGAYGTWQHSDGPLAPSFTEYGVFLALTLDAPPARL